MNNNEQLIFRAYYLCGLIGIAIPFSIIGIMMMPNPIVIAIIPITAGAIMMARHDTRNRGCVLMILTLIIVTISGLFL